MTNQGKTGNIHGIEVRHRQHEHPATVKINAKTVDGRQAILRAAEQVYNDHHAVIEALARR